jgi:hypothetical protein
MVYWPPEEVRQYQRSKEQMSKTVRTQRDAGVWVLGKVIFMS